MLAPAMLGVQYVLSIEGRLPLLVTTHSSLLLVRRRLCSCLYYIFARQAFDKTISFTIFFAYFSGHQIAEVAPGGCPRRLPHHTAEGYVFSSLQ